MTGRIKAAEKICSIGSDDIMPLLCHPVDHDDEQDDTEQTYDIGGSIARHVQKRIQTEAKIRVADIAGDDKAVEAARNHGNNIVLSVSLQVDADHEESEDSDQLVRESEVSPKHVETVAVGLGKEENHDCRDKDDEGKDDTLDCLLLIDVELLCDHETQGAEGGITGGDRKNDDTDDGEQTAGLADEAAGNDADHQSSIGVQLGAAIKHYHGAGCPYHGNKALRNHHIVEGLAPLSL